MVDGLHQSVIGFFIPYLLFTGRHFLTLSGLDVQDRLRFGAYIAHPAVLTINMYILINTYRWDWLMLLIVIISDLFVFFWTRVYTSFTSSRYFYGTALEVYREATFWAVFFLVSVVCLPVPTLRRQGVAEGLLAVRCRHYPQARIHGQVRLP